MIRETPGNKQMRYFEAWNTTTQSKLCNVEASDMEEAIQLARKHGATVGVESGNIFVCAAPCPVQHREDH